MSAADVRQAALRAAALKALLDEVRKAYDAARVEVDDCLVRLHTELGVTGVEVRLPGHDKPVAQLSLSEPKAGYVIDEAAFLTWCHREHPTEVETTAPEPVTSVRPAWRRALLARLDVIDGRTVDTETGRVLEFITVAEPAAPSSVLTWKTRGREHVAAAYRDDRLTLAEMLPLPTADRQ